MTSNISVVIPNFNGVELLQKNLQSVLSAKENSKNNIAEVIVVDDGSTDSSVEYLNSNFKGQIKLIKHTKNRGFSAAVNTGVRSSLADFILLLNTDVAVQKDFLIGATQIFEKQQKVFAISLHEKGYGYAKGLFSDGYINLAMGKEEKKITNSFYVSGGSGLFRKSIWKELGGMDEKLLSPFYWEDIDICYRAYKRGYVCLWNPNSHIEHNHESTVSKLKKSKVNLIRERNQLIVIWKNIHSKNMIRKHVAGVLKRLSSHLGYIKVIIVALLRLPLILKERKKEIKESKVSDEAIFAQFS